MDMASGNFSASGLMGQTTTSNITTANAIGSNASNSLPGNKETISMTLSTSLDAMFKRKRGRPPKNRVVEVCKFSYFTFIKKNIAIKFVDRFLNFTLFIFPCSLKTTKKTNECNFNYLESLIFHHNTSSIVASNLCLPQIAATFQFDAEYNNPSIFHPRSGMKT